jgi:excinuclease ABC subunit C
MDLAHRNAELFLGDFKTQKEKEQERPDRALLDLKEIVGLREPPGMIACFDVSNLGESFAVGSVVVFQGGRPARSRYRRFRIRTVEGQDDFAMMREIVTRFLARCREGEETSPDLILVDGGKGQLSAGLDALKASGLEIPVAALAKEREELFLPGSPEGRILPEGSPVRRLLVQMRNEAHRFAITYHRNSRSRALVTSLLDEVSGIGPKRRKRLLETFATIDELASAAPEEIAKKGHIPLDTAVKLTDFLRGMRAREN